MDSAYAFRRIVCALKGKEGKDLSFGLTLIGRAIDYLPYFIYVGEFMGEITYGGDFEPFWPYIRLGEYVHVGKGSSFGLGRYEVA